MRRLKIGILGATGLVGQRLLLALRDHPWFDVAALAASDRSAGNTYRDAVNWSISSDPPRPAADLTVRRCVPGDLDDCDVVLSGLDSDVAKVVEREFAEAGFPVVSNSSAYRFHDDVPLVVPEINADHLEMVRDRRGYIVTNPNCSTIGLALVAAPLQRAFGLGRIVVTTLQAVSGAGIAGPRALQMIDNVVPYIAGEEDKLERELPKILGRLTGGAIDRAPVVVSAHCHRVATVDGHLEAVSFELQRTAGPEQVSEVLAGFRPDPEVADLPSAPQRLIEVRPEPDRPQPRLDRDAGDGMAVVVGRVRRCPALGIKLELLSHNTVRGAAGGTLLNAELLAARGQLGKRAAD